MNPRRVVLLTGATGFVGAHAAAALDAAGWQVHALVRPSSAIDRLQGMVPGVTIARGDLSLDHLIVVLARVRPTVAAHLASRSTAEHRPDELEDLLASNIGFPTRLLEAMRLTQVCRRFVNIGTTWQHWRDASYDATCLYAATKQAFEAHLAYYAGSEGWHALSLALNDVYGPDDPRGKLFGQLHQAMRSGQPIALSPGEQLLDLIYGADAGAGIAVAVERLASRLDDEPALQEHFLLRSGDARPLRAIVGLYLALLDQPIEIRWGARPYRAREMMRPYAGGAVLPGWRPRVTLEDGLRELVAAQRAMNGSTAA